MHAESTCLANGAEANDVANCNWLGQARTKAALAMEVGGLAWLGFLAKLRLDILRFYWILIENDCDVFTLWAISSASCRAFGLVLWLLKAFEKAVRQIAPNLFR